MHIAIVIVVGVLSLAMILAMFATDRGVSHFDHMLDLYHARRLAKMQHDLELKKLELQMLNSPLPELESKKSE